MSLGDSPRRTIFPFFIPLIPFHLAANSIGEPQRFRIPTKSGTSDDFECAPERDAVTDGDVDGTFAARRSPCISADLTAELDRGRSRGDRVPGLTRPTSGCFATPIVGILSRTPT